MCPSAIPSRRRTISHKLRACAKRLATFLYLAILQTSKSPFPWLLIILYLSIGAASNNH